MEKMTMTVGAVAIGGLAMLASLRAQSTPANSTISANVIDVASIQTEIYRTSENDFECLARTGVKPPLTDNSTPVMKLLSFDARNTAAALAKTIFDVLRIIAVFLGTEPMHEKGKKRATAE